MRKSTKNNLASMLSKLEPVNVSVPELENLLLQTVLDSEETRDKLAAIRLLIEIKKHLATDNTAKDLLDILRGD